MRRWSSASSEPSTRSTAAAQFCARDQYRSAIFVAKRGTARVAAGSACPIPAAGTTGRESILPASRFYPAEDYHQDYYRKNPVRYRFYRWNCGREARLREVWSRAR